MCIWDGEKCKLHQKLIFGKGILLASKSVSFERNKNQDISALDDLYSEDLPEHAEDVADETITDAKVLICNKHFRKSYNGLDYEARVNHSNCVSLGFKSKKRNYRNM